MTGTTLFLETLYQTGLYMCLGSFVLLGLFAVIEVVTFRLGHADFAEVSDFFAERAGRIVMFSLPFGSGALLMVLAQVLPILLH